MVNLGLKQLLSKIPYLNGQKIIFPQLFSKKISSVIIIDLSSNLKILQVDLKGTPKINAIKISDLPVEKKEEFVLSSLKGFIKENNIEHKNAILSPTLKTFTIKRLQLPVVPKKEIIQTIKWLVKDELNFNIDSAVVDYQILRELNKEDGSKVFDLICVIAEAEEIKKQILFLKQLGFNCIAVNLLAFGYVKIIENFFGRATNQAIGFLNLDNNNCYIAVYKENKLDFYRELPVSIEKLKEALAGEVVTENSGRIKLTNEEINEALFKLGIPVEGSASFNKIATSQILAMLRQPLEKLAQEIKRSFMYYNSQFQAGSVNKILIAGEAIKINNLDGFLKKEMGIDISMMSVNNKDIAYDNVNSGLLPEVYAGFGLCFDLENNINLLPPEMRTEKIEMVQKASIRWIALIAFLLLVVFYIFAKMTVGLYEKRLSNALVHLEVLSQVQEMNSKTNKINSFIAEIDNLDEPTGQILKKLSSLSPKELFFDSLNLNVEAKTGSIIGFIKETENDPNAFLAKLVDGMNNSAYFKDVNIASVEKTDLRGAIVTKFQVNFKLL